MTSTENDCSWFLCEVCDYWIDRENMANHMWTHSAAFKNPLVCSFCDQEFSSVTDCNLHESAHQITKQPRNTYFECIFCNETFKTKHLLYRHCSELHILRNTDALSSSLCNQQEKVEVSGDVVQLELFDNSLSDLTSKKQKTKTKQKPVQCNVCNLWYANPYSLLLHYKIHNNIWTLSCQVCGERFRQISNLICHQAKAHKSVDNKKIVTTCSSDAVTTKLKCPLCSKSVGTQFRLKLHLRNHESGSSYECSICGKEFSSSSGLQYHQKIHKNDKSVQCSVCFKMMRGSYQLKLHFRQHSGERPYQCSKCLRQFAHLGSLKYHYSTHCH